MDLGFGGKGALISGGSRGIGLAIAVRLAQEGAKVSLLARGEAALQDAVARIQGEVATEDVHGYAADLCNTSEVEEAVRRATKAMGRLDVVVHCAGGAPLGSAVEATDKDWRAALEVKLLGGVRLCRAAAPHVETGGALINIAGSWGREPDASAAVGSATNAALAAYSKSLANLLAPQRIRVFCVNPTATRTELWVDVAKRFGDRFGKSGDEFTRIVASHIPLGRIAEPDDVARVVVFLASEAASFLTGLALDVDGGSHSGVY